MHKITLEHIESVIDHESYIIEDDSTLIICILTLINGFKVVGKSACCDPDIYDETTGKEIAHTHAMSQVWELEGYLLKQMMMCEAEAEAEYEKADKETEKQDQDDEPEKAEEEKEEVVKRQSASN